MVYHKLFSNGQKIDLLKTADSKEGIRFSLGSNYDYTKPFAQQLDDYEQNKIPAHSSLFLGPTPEVLKKIGFVSLPVTINQEHVGYALKGNYKGSAEEIKDHIIPKDELAKLPQKIANPVAIIQDKQVWKDKASEYVVDVLVTMKINGKDVLVPVRVGGRANLNEQAYDCNVLTTVHGDKDTIDRLINAINEDSDDNYSLYFLNNKKAKEIIQSDGNPIPTVIEKFNGFIHSITDSASPVKPRINSQQETLQFKRWFGKSIMTEDGRAGGKPKVFYHGTDQYGFDVFRDNSFFTDDKQFAKRYETPRHKDYKSGTYEVYLRIEKPFDIRNPKDRKIFTEYRNGHKPTQTHSGAMEWTDFDYDDLTEYLKENYPNKYDGYVIQETYNNSLSYVPFEKSQIKSATDNIGTFDRNNDSIRYSLAGMKARTADIATLEKARKLLADGVDKKEVWQKTGWYIAKDGKPRFEISDKKFAFNDNFYRKVDSLTSQNDIFCKLDDVVDHDQLFNAYPELRDIKVRLYHDPNSKAKAGFYEEDNYENNTREKHIDINIKDINSIDIKGMRRSIIHELQHAIQRIENFAIGSSPAQERMKLRAEKGRKHKFTEEELKTIETEGKDRYMRHYGEGEARTVSKRLDYEDSDRSKTMPEQDFDYDVNDSIIAHDESFVNHNTRFSLAGTKAKTANIATLDEARKMLADGADKKEVWQKTGWYIAKDGKPRFEIDDNLSNQITRYSLASKKDSEWLENSKKIKVYRAMVLIDGKLYPPMSTKVRGVLRDPVQFGKWYKSDEDPSIITNKKIKKNKKTGEEREIGYITLEKSNGKNLSDVAYNPYWHASVTMLNDQFTSAWDRPELVVVECEIAEDDINEKYRADLAKDYIGKSKWHSGTVSSRLQKLGRPAREVYLSRYIKALRIVPNAEVAQSIADMVKGTNVEMPENVVTPEVLENLKKLGVKIGKPVGLTPEYIQKHRQAKEEANNNSRSFSLRSKQTESDKKYKEALRNKNSKKARAILNEAARKAGYDGSIYYHGNGENNTINEYKGNNNRKEDQGLNLIKGFFTDQKKYASQYGKITKHYIDTRNFLHIPSQSVEEMKNFLEKKGIKDVVFNDFINDKESLGNWYEETGQDYLDAWMFFNENGGNLTHKIAEAGYKGVMWDEGLFDQDGGTAVMPFSAELIKSADLITRDDEGNIIPLSERFNDSNKDIRYSKRKRSDNRYLSKNSLEFGFSSHIMSLHSGKNFDKSEYGLHTNYGNYEYFYDYFGNGEFGVLAKLDIEEKDLTDQITKELYNGKIRSSKDVARIIEIWQRNKRTNQNNGLHSNVQWSSFSNNGQSSGTIQSDQDSESAGDDRLRNVTTETDAYFKTGADGTNRPRYEKVYSLRNVDGSKKTNQQLWFEQQAKFSKLIVF